MINNINMNYLLTKHLKRRDQYLNKTKTNKKTTSIYESCESISSLEKKGSHPGADTKIRSVLNS